MRAFIAAIGLVAVLAVCAALAPGQSASSSRLGPLGIYQCPDHPEIQATWRAQCPTCGTTLQAVQLLNAAVETLPIAEANYYPDQDRPSPQNPPYGNQRYYPPPQTGQYGNQGNYPYPPSGQYGSQGYPPSGQYGGQQYPYGYPPPSGQYGSQGYPPSGQYGGQQYPHGYPPSGQYGGQGYPPGQYPYPPSGQYGQGYPPSSPGYGYGQGGYRPPTEPNRPTEPNSPYAGLLNELNKLFNKRRQQGSQQP
jgi:hypothetical protein